MGLKKLEGMGKDISSMPEGKKKATREVLEKLRALAEEMMQDHLGQKGLIKIEIESAEGEAPEMAEIDGEAGEKPAPDMDGAIKSAVECAEESEEPKEEGSGAMDQMRELLKKKKMLA